jgi:beta-carotene hydroxylase
MNQPDKLDQEALSHSKRYMGKFAWLTVFYGISVCGSYLMIVALAMLGKLPLLMAFPLVALLTYLTYTLLHEAAHGSISGSRKSLRWVNEALGYMAAWILMIPLTAHRHEHLAHHRHTNEPDGDPDYAASGLGGNPTGVVGSLRHSGWAMDILQTSQVDEGTAQAEPVFMSRDCDRHSASAGVDNVWPLV